MRQEQIEGRDYDRVISKMPRYDKEGRDVTGDKMGPGGRRKDDGRQSVQAYDFEEYNEEESREELEERLRLYAEAEEREHVLRKERMQDEIETFFVLLEMTAKFLENHPKLVVKMVDGVRTLRGKVADGFRLFHQNVSDLKVKLIPKKGKKSKQTVICEVIQEGETGTSEQLLVVECGGDVAIPEENYGHSKRIILSKEEAVSEVFNALNHYIGLTRSLNKLSNANVIDMKALGFEGVIVKLEDCMQQYPALMDKGNQRKILEILGADFDEIEKKRVKEVLEIDCI